VLSGLAAAHLLGLLRGPAPDPEVTALTERRVKGVMTRRCRRLDPREMTAWRGIPVTTVARTLVDLAAAVSEPELARACHEAGVRHGTTPAQVEAVLARQPNAPGARSLRRVLHGHVPVTLSKLESRFLSLLRGPGCQSRRPTAWPVDGAWTCRWPDTQLTVELDGYRYHHSRYAWEQDRRREREARARGDEFRRDPYGDVFESPELMLSELRGLTCQA
jgi:hypothetical protein